MVGYSNGKNTTITNHQNMGYNNKKNTTTSINLTRKSQNNYDGIVSSNKKNTTMSKSFEFWQQPTTLNPKLRLEPNFFKKLSGLKNPNLTNFLDFSNS
jgi:hypothetical protein